MNDVNKEKNGSIRPDPEKNKINKNNNIGPSKNDITGLSYTNQWKFHANILSFYLIGVIFLIIFISQLTVYSEKDVIKEGPGGLNGIHLLVLVAVGVFIYLPTKYFENEMYDEQNFRGRKRTVVVMALTTFGVLYGVLIVILGISIPTYLYTEIDKRCSNKNKDGSENSGFFMERVKSVCGSIVELFFGSTISYATAIFHIIAIGIIARNTYLSMKQNTRQSIDTKTKKIANASANTVKRAKAKGLMSAKALVNKTMVSSEKIGVTTKTKAISVKDRLGAATHFLPKKKK